MRVSACAPASMAMVPKNASWRSEKPARTAQPASSRVCRLTRLAIRRSPSGPCQTGYMPAITASSTWAVQMFEVAFSRRICCSRVCRARRIAGWPAASWLTPTRRPGMWRLKLSRVAMKPACGPPKPIGTPKRCAEPTTMSAPISPGGVSSTRASGSAATIASAPESCASVISAVRSRTAPVEPGYCSSTAKGFAARIASRSPGAMSARVMPSGRARVATTARVCGCRSVATASTSLPVRATACAIDIASAAAVASSSSEALAISMPVSSVTSVWKFSSASSRPCAISAWYGV